ncbi:MAG: hypothetical protein DRN81_01280 [Thermoproteota archaeon]|nr:MAG: hypothetical protein DRN81_01280 [Candidatus Korarchaeota archaeon]
MTPEQIIDEVWKLSWFEVFQIAVMDDLILLAKSIHGILIACVLSALVVIVMHKNKKRSMMQKESFCFKCNEQFVDDYDNDIIIITDIFDDEMMIKLHRECAELWVKQIDGGSSIANLNIEPSEVLGEFISSYLQQKYKGLHRFKATIV